MVENKDAYREDLERKPTPDETKKEIGNLIKKGDYMRAEVLARSANLSDKDWQKINNGLNDQIREVSPDVPQKGPLTFEEAQNAVNFAGDHEIIKYGEMHKPDMKELSKMQETVTESDEVLDEILGLIKKAKSSANKNMWAKPIGILALPIISDIYAIAKGNKLRKLLKKLEDSNVKLNNPEFLSSNVKADRISPNNGHIIKLAGFGTMAGGAALMATGPIGMGIGLGTFIAGGLTSAIGTIKQIMDLASVSNTRESLKDLEKKVEETRTRNTLTKERIDTYQKAYVTGARENLQPMLA